jgi:hypothetical protein
LGGRHGLSPYFRLPGVIDVNRLLWEKAGFLQVGETGKLTGLIFKWQALETASPELSSEKGQRFRRFFRLLPE